VKTVNNERRGVQDDRDSPLHCYCIQKEWEVIQPVQEAKVCGRTCYEPFAFLVQCASKEEKRKETV
jgi:hypothetical protein